MEKRQCPECDRPVIVMKNGGLRKHPCTSGKPVSAPAPTVEPMDDEDDTQDFRDPVSPTRAATDEETYQSTKGPWFGAMYAGTCDGCFDRIHEGDRIRADGQGGYECTPCGDNGEDAIVVVPVADDWQEQASAAAKRHQTLLTLAAEGPSGDMASDAFAREQERAAERLAQIQPYLNRPAPMPTADEFMDPAPVERMFIKSPEEKIVLPTPDEFLSGPHAHSASDAANAYGSMGGADLMDADEFMDPAIPDVKLNVSGQPEARRDYLKRYIVIDPEIGDFRRTKKERKPFGITRATTFNKHAQNTIALNGWSKRNVVMGASLRPDILRRAHGLHHDRSKDERETLDLIVDELEKAAGAKVAADEGTFLHEFCEQVDAGLKTWQDAPAAYQQDIKRYVEALAAEGLEPVPGLIERTTFIREYGGVCGTFDNVYYHRPSGQYVIGDKKTGKTMKYAMDETECQLWTYAHGVNQTGIYDWNTDTWCPVLFDPARGPVRVSEAVGVIVHMPVQGPEAGEVYLRFANLERGRAYAELNNAVKSYEKSKVRPFEMPVLSWEARFAAVTSGEEATALWREAKAAGKAGVELNDLVEIARTALRSKG